MELNVAIEGHTESDLAQALDEVKRLVEGGNRAGLNSNDTGSFSFETNGSPVHHYEVKPNGCPRGLTEEQFNEQFDPNVEDDILFQTFDEAREWLDATGPDTDLEVVGVDDRGWVHSRWGYGGSDD